MFRRLLVPLDGSARAERAALTAARIARATGSSILLHRVVEVAARTGPAFEVPPVMLSQIEHDIVNATEYLERFAGRPEFTGLAIDKIVLEGGVADTIIETIADESVDLVVMCSHGQGGVLHLALGSVARGLARHAPVPLLILRENGSIPGSDTSAPAHRALVALDGSAFAERAIKPAATLLAGLSAGQSAELMLVRVALQASGPSGTSNGVEAGQYLAALRERLQQTPAEYPVQVASQVLHGSHVAKTLIEAAGGGMRDEREPVYDFLAVATHGRGGLQRLRLGSVTGDILRDARVPLLIIPLLTPASDAHGITPATATS